MKKIIYNKYGSFDVLQLSEVPIPEITENDILVKVKAVSVNPLDWKILKGDMKLMSGKTFPKGIGIDFSGVIEKTGSKVQGFTTGDEVFGLVDPFKGSAMADYVVVREEAIARKPSHISYEQAAALPVTGMAALQILERLISIKKGSEILIKGASGGIGMFAVQIAGMKGAIVTAVAGSASQDLVKKWGSSHILDYNKLNILESDKNYDAVIDLSGKMPFKAAKVILNSGGVYVNSTPGPKEMLESFLNNLFSSRKYKLLLLKISRPYLLALAELADKGLNIHLGAVYPAGNFKDAYIEVSQRGIAGKAVFKWDTV